MKLSWTSTGVRHKANSVHVRVSLFKSYSGFKSAHPFTRDGYSRSSWVQYSPLPILFRIARYILVKRDWVRIPAVPAVHRRSWRLVKVPTSARECELLLLISRLIPAKREDNLDSNVFRSSDVKELTASSITSYSSVIYADPAIGCTRSFSSDKWQPAPDAPYPRTFPTISACCTTSHHHSVRVTYTEH